MNSTLVMNDVSMMFLNLILNLSLSLHRHLQEPSESSKSLFVMIWSKVSYKFHVFTKSPRGAVAV